jgi:DNA repair photolyase
MPQDRSISTEGLRPADGRGATINPSGRYERHTTEPFDDGWGTGEPEQAGTKRHPHPKQQRAGNQRAAEQRSETGPLRADDEADDEVRLRARLRTTVTPEAARTIITRNDSPDVPFERSINPYRGCEHGCIYCFARPSHAYAGLSPGLDFETRIFAKANAVTLLRKELRQPRYVPDVIALGANTDPYQPAERDLEITRRIVGLLAECEHPLSIVTKSALVLRDLELLAAMAARRLCHVYVSITTLDPELARRMEPRASTPRQRLATLEALASRGVPCGVLASPMIPALNDWELERILAAAAGAGASTAGYILLRLPLELKELFEAWLETHYPGKARHVLELVRNTRGGELYRGGFGQRMRGTGAYARAIEARFELARRRSGLESTPPPLDPGRFRPPREAVSADARPGRRMSAQLDLFADDGEDHRRR